MIIWTGWGVLVFVFALVALVLAEALSDAAFGAGYYAANSWPKLAAIAVAAVAIWLTGRRLNAERGRTVTLRSAGG